MASAFPRSPAPPARDGLWTLPNILSLLRIAAVPFFLWAMIGRQPLAALILFAAAGLTDFLDGLAARSLGLRSAWGAVLDPAADKILMTAAYVACSLPALSKPNVLPLALVILVIGRDVAIALGALVLRRLTAKKSFSPSWWGKVSTVCQVACLFLVLVFNALRVRMDIPLTVMYVLTASVTVISGGYYFWVGFLKEFKRST